MDHLRKQNISTYNLKLLGLFFRCLYSERGELHLVQIVSKIIVSFGPKGRVTFVSNISLFNRTLLYLHLTVDISTLCIMLPCIQSELLKGNITQGHQRIFFLMVQSKIDNSIQARHGRERYRPLGSESSAATWKQRLENNKVIILLGHSFILMKLKTALSNIRLVMQYKSLDVNNLHIMF